jgi:PIN domain nuclease of toxin-antitoxin system
LSQAYLDTHVAVWLHDGLIQKLTKAAKQEIERSDLLLSPMVYLEFDYLHRRGRIRYSAAEVFANLSTTFGITLCEYPFPAVAGVATGLGWTTNPFDRIIVAQAQANQFAPLISADEVIRQHYRSATW